MTDLRYWYQAASQTSQFRTEDFRIWWDRSAGFCLAYRSPLWSRLPVRKFRNLYRLAEAIGEQRGLEYVKGTIK